MFDPKRVRMSYSLRLDQLRSFCFDFAELIGVPLGSLKTASPTKVLRIQDNLARVLTCIDKSKNCVKRPL